MKKTTVVNGCQFKFKLSQYLDGESGKHGASALNLVGSANGPGIGIAMDLIADTNISFKKGSVTPNLAMISMLKYSTGGIFSFKNTYFVNYIILNEKDKKAVSPTK